MIGILETVDSLLQTIRPRPFESFSDAFKAARAEHQTIFAEIRGGLYTIRQDGSIDFLAKAPTQ